MISQGTQLMINRVRFSVVGLSMAVIFQSTFASAGPACDGAAFQQLKQAVFMQNNNWVVPLSPAITYRGLNGSQMATNHANGTAESQYSNQLFNRLATAAKTFLGSNGDVASVAQRVFGAPDRRQATQIVKRPSNSNGAAATTNARCGSGSCADMALEVSAMHLVPGRSAQAVIDLVSSSKLATFGSATSLFCELDANCKSKSDLDLGQNARVQKSSEPAPMKIGTTYAVREIVSAGMMGKIDNTSVYKVTALQICGQPAFLMSGISTRDQNSFVNSSSNVLVLELGANVMTLAFAQGVAERGSSVPSIFLGMFAGKAKNTVTEGYNDEAKRLGTSEVVDKNGSLSR